MSALKKAISPITKFARGAHNLNVNKVGVLGVPFDKGQKKTGVGNGPKCLREAKLIQQLNSIRNTDIKDYGDVKYNLERKDSPTVKNMIHYEDVVTCNKCVAKNVEKVVRDGRTCLILGGDHSIGLGSVSGHCKAKDGNVSLVWVDAHADINTNVTSGSGNIHGMPVSMLTTELTKYWQKLPGMEWHKPCLSIKNIAYIGLRSVDHYEQWLIEKLGITAFYMFDVQKYGIDAVLSKALAAIDPQANRSIHLSFDIDAVDPSDAPSTGTAVPGGLLLREAIYIADTVHATSRLGAMDLVEVNPNLGSDADVKKTVHSAVHIILAAFGNYRRGTLPGMPALQPVSS